MLKDASFLAWAIDRLHFLNGFDYIYDAEGGFVRFRWTGRVSPAFGKVAPSPH